MKRSKPKIQYPSLKIGQVATIERPETGKNIGKPHILPNGTVAPARVQRGVFQFTRLAPKPSRSKYDPNTEAAKHGETNAK
jgi:hypothetical protein